MAKWMDLFLHTNWQYELVKTSPEIKFPHEYS